MDGVVVDIGHRVVAGLGQWGVLVVIQALGAQVETLAEVEALAEEDQVIHGER